MKEELPEVLIWFSDVWKTSPWVIMQLSIHAVVSCWCD